MFAIVFRIHARVSEVDVRFCIEMSLRLQRGLSLRKNVWLKSWRNFAYSNLLARAISGRRKNGYWFICARKSILMSYSRKILSISYLNLKRECNHDYLLWVKSSLIWSPLMRSLLENIGRDQNMIQLLMHSFLDLFSILNVGRQYCASSNSPESRSRTK